MNNFKKLLFSVLVSALTIVAFSTAPAAHAASGSITVNSVELTLFDDTDALGAGNGYADIDDFVQLRISLDNTDGGCVAAGTTITANLLAYGSINNYPISCVTDNGGIGDIFQLQFRVGNAWQVNGIDVGPNDASSSVAVIIDDPDEIGINVNSNNLGDGVIDTTTVNGVDTIGPYTGLATTVTPNCTGTGGACKIGDTVTLTVDTNEATAPLLVQDILVVSASFHMFGPDAYITLTDSGINGDVTSGDGIYTHEYTVAIDADDVTNASFVVAAVDDASNYGSVNQGTNITVDNEEPVLSNAAVNMDVTGCTGPNGICIAGDSLVFTWDNSATGDNNSDIDTVTFDLTAFGGTATEAATDDGLNGDATAGDGVFTKSYELVEGSVDANGLGYTIKVTDDAGNPQSIIGLQTADVDAQTPTESLNFAVSSISGAIVDLSWDASVAPDLTSYEIYYSTSAGVTKDNGFLWDSQDDGNLASAATTSTSIPLSLNETFYFTIYALDDAGLRSPAAPEVSATTQASSTGGGGGSNLLLGGGGGSSSGGSVLGETDSSEEEETTEEATEPAPTDGSFTDISGHWAESFIKALHTAGVVSGKQPGIFAPDQPVTRAEFLKMALEAAAVTMEENGTENYSDVATADWFHKYVVTGSNMEYVEGYGDGTFRPNATITRVEALAMLVEVFNQDYGTEVKNTFPDTDATAWYAALLSFSVENGTVSGYEDGTFGPGAPITRAESAKIISSMFVPL